MNEFGYICSCNKYMQTLLIFTVNILRQYNNINVEGTHTVTAISGFLCFVECCHFLVKYFNFCWCEVAAVSKQRLGLLSAILIPSWWLVCVAKVNKMRVLVSVGIITDVQISTCTKCCPARRMTVGCVAIFTINDGTFEWLHVIRVS